MYNVYYFKYGRIASYFHVFQSNFCNKYIILLQRMYKNMSWENYNGYHISHNQDKHMYYDTIPDTSIRFYAKNMLIIRWCTLPYYWNVLPTNVLLWVDFVFDCFVDIVYSGDFFCILFPRDQSSNSKINDQYWNSIV